ncbi:MAG: hypothetical protein A2527_06565 [Candidatus Lambdaproteobacteria bacterium RIFOXYD2_FULL_50_16]|uniref:Stress-response A/B barrel domain-containing protein n=1 Tax=Candidatus Lambdaproteobacteria bacterium RIFOXYD2_FULL_50_16 TaxID=1817772 RepID=A0A1F6GA56_9PROT|nr:MAG: hypothetical protein A2527_06565 [Candidatus Lambdaproteobacteria bacterium RIFOXYD2_FULL_50_16]
MIKHLVLFQFKEPKLKALDEAAAQLKALLGVVPSLRSMEVGVDFVKSERSMDLSLIATFDDEAGLEAYIHHPAHQEVATFIKAHALLSKACDYQF